MTPSAPRTDYAHPLRVDGGSGQLAEAGYSAHLDQLLIQLLLTTPGTLLIHLQIELATTLSRCAGTEALRPVLADHANLANRYHRRLPLYRAAHVSIAVDALTPEEAVEAILNAARLA